MSVSYSFTVISLQADDVKYCVVHTTAGGSHNITGAMCVNIPECHTVCDIFYCDKQIYSNIHKGH